MFPKKENDVSFVHIIGVRKTVAVSPLPFLYFIIIKKILRYLLSFGQQKCDRLNFVKRYGQRMVWGDKHGSKV